MRIFKFKLYGGLTIITFLLIGLILIAIITIVKCKVWIRKINYLESIGFEKKLWRVASIGNHADYRYVKGNIKIEENEIEKNVFKRIKEKI